MNKKNVKHNPKSRRYGKRRLKRHWKVIFSIAGLIILVACIMHVITPGNVHVEVEESSVEASNLQPVYITKDLPKDDSSLIDDPEVRKWMQVHKDLTEKNQEDWQKEKEAFDSFDWSNIGTIGCKPKTPATIPQLSESDIDMLCQLAQAEALELETSGHPNCDTVMQYVVAVAINRIGEDGFGPDMSYGDSLYTVLSNMSQYKNLLDYIDQYDPNDTVARRNVMKVLSGEAQIPKNLFFEKCTTRVYHIDNSIVDPIIDEKNFWGSEAAAKEHAENEFYACYPNAKQLEIVYMIYTPEGRYMQFATNPYGAYADEHILNREH